MEAVGLSDEKSFLFPVTQVDLADALGFSAVHVNRMLQELRSKDLIEWTGRTVEILDRPGLELIAQFDPRYLNHGQQHR